MARFVFEREGDSNTFFIYDTKGLGRGNYGQQHIGDIDQEYFDRFERALKLLEYAEEAEKTCVIKL